MPLALAATFPAILRAVTTLFAVGSFIQPFRNPRSGRPLEWRLEGCCIF
jgi:hypothetical protein